MLKIPDAPDQPEIIKVVRSAAEVGPDQPGVRYWWPSLGTAVLQGAKPKQVIVDPSLANDSLVLEALREIGPPRKSGIVSFILRLLAISRPAPRSR